MAELIRAGLRATARRDHGGELAFEFASAENGADAIALLERSRFDVVILDMYLPIVDGAHVIGRARKELGLVDLPIIAVSAGGVTARATALLAGASMYLDKPVRLRQMVDTMRELSVL
jgi:CheY-like chemotaxis protein